MSELTGWRSRIRPNPKTGKWSEPGDAVVELGYSIGRSKPNWRYTPIECPFCNEPLRYPDSALDPTIKHGRFLQYTTPLDPVTNTRECLMDSAPADTLPLVCSPCKLTFWMTKAHMQEIYGVTA